MKPASVVWSLVAVVLLAGSVARAQSLGDIAKKTEDERRKAGKTPAPAKVYTNDDLKAYPVSPSPSTTEPDATAPPTSTPAPGDKPAEGGAKPGDKDDAPRDEAYWKGQLSSAQAKLDRDESFRAALETRINSLTNDFYSRDDPAQRAAIWSQRTKALEDMERLKKDVSDGHATIAKIREDARKAGVPAGWLR
jgi:hypothetical protein